MQLIEYHIEELRAAVATSPDDAYHRCNLACSLAASGRIDEALVQLAAAYARATSPISAGCVAVATRDVADSISQSWSLPFRQAAPLSAIA